MDIIRFGKNKLKGDNKMKKYEDFIESLNSIVEECKSNESCCTCCFSHGNGKCGIAKNPRNWRVAKEPKAYTKVMEQ